MPPLTSALVPSRVGRAPGRALVVSALLGLLLGGCSVLPTGSIDTYDLSATSQATSARTVSAQVLVPEPVALKALDTERILVRPKPSEINYYPGAQWSDRLPKLVQSRLIESFENSAHVRAGRPGQGLLIDYQVVTEIRAFEYDATTRKARIEISAKLMNDHTGRVVTSEVFRSEVDCASDSAKAVVTALDAALDLQLKAIIGWAIKRI